MLQRGPRLFRELSVVVYAPLVAGDSGDEQRNENHVKRDDRAPEMNFPERLIEHAAKHFRVPESESGKNGNDGDGDERVMEVRDQEIRVVQINIRAGGAEENSRHTADHKLRDEPQSPKHRRVQMD